jgi:hypothetical protein
MARHAFERSQGHRRHDHGSWLTILGERDLTRARAVGALDRDVLAMDVVAADHECLARSRADVASPQNHRTVLASDLAQLHPGIEGQVREGRQLGFG